MPSRPLDTFSDEAQELVRRRLAGLGANPDPAPAQNSTTDTAPAPLSPDQRRLWFLAELRPGRTDYNVATSWRIRGPIDTAALDAALIGLVTRHEALRAVVVVERGEPLQRISPPPAAVLDVVELDVELDVSPSAARRFAFEHSAAPFDLEAGPLYRFSLARIGRDEHILSVAVHHLVVDRDSLAVLLGDLVDGYARAVAGAPAAPAPPTARYVDYARAQAALPRGAESPHREYWAAALRDVAPVLDLPTDRDRPRATLSGDAGAARAVLDRDTAEAVRGLAAEAATTPFVVCLAAFDALLHRYTGATSFAVGCPFTARNSARLEEVVGFFARSLPIVSRPRPDTPFLRLVAEVREAMLGAHEHQEIPLEDLVALLDAPRDPSVTPLFQVWFDYAAAHPEDVEWPPPLEATTFACGDERTRFDLELHLTESADGTHVRLLYAAELFDAQTGDEFVEHYVRLLAGAVAQPSVTLARLPLLGAEQVRTIVSGWGATPGGT